MQFVPTGYNILKMSPPLQVLQNKSKGGDLNVVDMWMTSLVERYKDRPNATELKMFVYRLAVSNSESCSNQMCNFKSGKR